MIQGEIRSPNVVALYNAAVTKHKYWLLMEICNGGDLKKYIGLRDGYLKEPEARLILRQIVRGITAIK